MEQFDCMVGVSTRQNSTNLIPALQYRPKSFLIVETTKATSDQWSRRLRQVLRQRNIALHEPLVLSSEDDSHIDRIAKQLDKMLENVERVIWNLGGGQKTQQFALWQTFKKRVAQGRQDQACYSNPNKHLIECWVVQKGGDLEYEQLEIKNDISLKEFLPIFGFKMKRGQRLFRQNQIPADHISPDKQLPDLLRFQEFREYLFRLPQTNTHTLEQDISYKLRELAPYFEKARVGVIQKVADYLRTIYDNTGGCQAFTPAAFQNYANGIGKRVIQEMKRVLRSRVTQKTDSISIQDPQLQEYLANLGKAIPTSIALNKDFLRSLCDFEKASEYFEKIVIQRVQNWLYESQHAVAEAYANVELERLVENDKQQKPANVTAEYDVLLLTQWGTLVALDAKTFDFKKKDEDARLYNLQLAGGTYVTFMAIFPYHPQDVQQDYMPRELKRLPLQLQKRQSKFAVIADGLSDAFTIIIENQEVPCNLWQQALQKLVCTNQ